MRSPVVNPTVYNMFGLKEICLFAMYIHTKFSAFCCVYFLLHINNTINHILFTIDFQKMNCMKISIISVATIKRPVDKFPWAYDNLKSFLLQNAK